MKKLFLVFLLALIPVYNYACSSCNREFTEAEKISFFLATFFLLFLVFIAGLGIYKIFKKYNNQ